MGDGEGIVKVAEWVRQNWATSPWHVKGGVWIVGVAAVLGVALYVAGLAKSLWKNDKPVEQATTWQPAPPEPTPPAPGDRVRVNIQRFQATGQGQVAIKNLDAVNLSSEGGVGGSVVIGGDPDSRVSTLVENSSVTGGSGSVRGGDVQITGGMGQSVVVKASTVHGGNSK